MFGIGADESCHEFLMLFGTHTAEDKTLEVEGHFRRRFFIAGLGEELRFQQHAQIGLHIVF